MISVKTRFRKLLYEDFELYVYKQPMPSTPALNANDQLRHMLCEVEYAIIDAIPLYKNMSYADRFHLGENNDATRSS